MNAAQYEEFARNRGLTEYAFDGAILPSAWRTCNSRLLFYLKENYGYRGCGVTDIQKLAHCWYDNGIKTYRSVALLAASLHIALGRSAALSLQEFEDLKRSPTIVRESLNRVAIVNVKKTSGASKSDDREIRRESRRNADWLSWQLRQLEPKHIIAGGTVCWHSLTLDLDLFRHDGSVAKHSFIRKEGTLIYHASHPAARGRSFDPFRVHVNMTNAQRGQSDANLSPYI